MTLILNCLFKMSFLSVLLLLVSPCLVTGEYYTYNRYNGGSRTLPDSSLSREMSAVLNFLKSLGTLSTQTQGMPKLQMHLPNDPSPGPPAKITDPKPRNNISQSSAASRVADRSYLDPVNFRSPTMTLQEMEIVLAQLEKHTGNKKTNKTADYTGSRLLVHLLREQCSRLIPLGTDRIGSLCSQLDDRLRPML